MAAYLVDLLLRDSSPTKGDTPTMETTDIVEFAHRDGVTDALTDLLRTGAQQLIATTVEAKFADICHNLLTCALKRVTRQLFVMVIIWPGPSKPVLAL